MEFGCQDLHSSTEMGKVARTVPHRNACVVGAAADVLDSQGKHLLLPRGKFLPVVNLSYSLKWPGFAPWSACVCHISA